MQFYKNVLVSISSYIYFYIDYFIFSQYLNYNFYLTPKSIFTLFADNILSIRLFISK